MRYLIGLGSSHPLGVHYLSQALQMMRASSSLKVISSSRFYKTLPIGGATSFMFTNAACALNSSLAPTALFSHMHMIEQFFGRLRVYCNGPRTLDLDILWYSGASFTDCGITVPHPYFTSRPFALVPAYEAASQAGWVLPYALQKSQGFRDCKRF